MRCSFLHFHTANPSNYYDAVPDGVVNDRFGSTHWDFRTSEYEAGRAGETKGTWENTRGIGFSFGWGLIYGYPLNRVIDGLPERFPLLLV